MKATLAILLTLLLNEGFTQCPCELTIRQVFDDSDYQDNIVTYSCSDLDGNDIQSNVILIEGSRLYFEYCTAVWFVRDCESGVFWYQIHQQDPGNGDFYGLIPVEDEIEFFEVECEHYHDGELVEEDVNPHQIIESFTIPSYAPQYANGIVFTPFAGGWPLTIPPIEPEYFNDIILKYGRFNVYQYDAINSQSKFLREISSHYHINTVKISTDGSEILHFTLPSGGDIELRGGNDAILHGVLFKDGNLYKYISPEKYDSDIDTIYVDWIPNGYDGPALSLFLLPSPPPVLLLHGLRSDNSVWASLKADLLDNGWKSEYILAPNYQNDAYFTFAPFEILPEVHSWLQDLRNSKLIFNHISVVGHSMGGLVARQYETNLGKEIISKIITLNTPHSGSEWANFALDHPWGSELSGPVLRIVDSDFNLHGGGVSSLKVGSSFLQSLNSTESDVKSHSISSEFIFCDVWLEEDPFIRDPLIVLSGLAGILINFAYYSIGELCHFNESIVPAPNDFVVRFISQAGGLEGNANTHLIGVENTLHTETDKNETALNKIVELLHDSPESNVFSDGFDPTPITPPIWRSSSLHNDSISVNVLNLELLDTIYNKVSTKLFISGSENVNGILVTYYLPAIDSVIFDTSFSRADTFTIRKIDYTGDVLILVLGSNGEGLADLQIIESFFTENSPPFPITPLLVFPEDSTTVSVNDVRLLWNVMPYADEYEIHVSKDSVFSGLVLDSIILSNSIDLRNLDIDTKYFWRIRGKNIVGFSDWSEEWDFTTKVPAPEMPELIYPQNNEVSVSLDSNFKWKSSYFTDSYSLLIALDSIFSLDVLEINNITDTSYVILNLDHGTEYYWRVKAINTSGESEWSTTRKFRTESLSDIKIMGQENDMRVFPNPIIGNEFWVQTENRSGRIVVFNLSGKEVPTSIEAPLESDLINVKLLDIMSGLYLVMLVTDSECEIIKLVKL